MQQQFPQPPRDTGEAGVLMLISRDTRELGVQMQLELDYSSFNFFQGDPVMGIMGHYLGNSSDSTVIETQDVNLSACHPYHR